MHRVVQVQMRINCDKGTRVQRQEGAEFLDAGGGQQLAFTDGHS